MWRPRDAVSILVVVKLRVRRLASRCVPLTRMACSWRRLARCALGRAHAANTADAAGAAHRPRQTSCGSSEAASLGRSIRLLLETLPPIANRIIRATREQRRDLSPAHTHLLDAHADCVVLLRRPGTPVDGGRPLRASRSARGFGLCVDEARGGRGSCRRGHVRSRGRLRRTAARERRCGRRGRGRHRRFVGKAEERCVGAVGAQRWVQTCNRPCQRGEARRS